MIKLGVYEHYKGNKYEVIGLARHSETLDKFVVYKALYGDYRIWIRPYDMFVEMIQINGTSKNRFKFLHSTMEDFPNSNRISHV